MGEGAMDPKRGANIFTCLAIVLFVGILVRVFHLHGEVNSRPCDKITPADNATAIATASVANFFPEKIWLGSPLCVAISGPADIAVDKDGKPTTLHLFLDSLELKDSVGTIVDRKKNLVQFDVVRTTTNDEAVWSKIVGQLDWGMWGARALVHVGVGTDKGEFSANANQPSLTLMMVDLVSLILGVGSFLAAVVALVYTARISTILRDGGINSSYSLARVQMAFWLYLITAAFVFIWLVTGDYNGVLTPQALTLMGISATTALMAISVDKPKTPVPPAANVPAGSPAPVVPAVPPAPVVPAVAAAAATPGALAAFQQFLMDILSEGDGVALHRLQIVVWTAIL